MEPVLSVGNSNRLVNDGKSASVVGVGCPEMGVGEPLPNRFKCNYLTVAIILLVQLNCINTLVN